MLVAGVPQLGGLLLPAPRRSAAGRTSATRLVARSRCLPSRSSAACWWSARSRALLNLALAPDRVYPLYGFHYARPPGDRSPDQRQVLHLSVRRQLLRRPLPALDRLRPLGGRADRLELRPGGEAREPVPDLDRHRDDGRRRAVGHQRRLLEHLVPGLQDDDRRPQLPRQLDRLSLAGTHGDEHPARDEGHGPRRRRSARERGAAGLAELRDPALGRARRPLRTPQRGAERRRRLAAKNRHNAGTIGLFLLARWGYVFGITLLASGAAALSETRRRGGDRDRRRARAAVHGRLFRPGGARARPGSARFAPASARSTSRTSGATSATGS